MQFVGISLVVATLAMFSAVLVADDSASIKATDTNKDGKVSAADFDKNNDGAIDEVERQTAFRYQMARRPYWIDSKERDGIISSAEASDYAAWLSGTKPIEPSVFGFESDVGAVEVDQFDLYLFPDTLPKGNRNFDTSPQDGVVDKQEARVGLVYRWQRLFSEQAPTFRKMNEETLDQELNEYVNDNLISYEEQSPSQFAQNIGLPFEAEGGIEGFLAPDGTMRQFLKDNGIPLLIRRSKLENSIRTARALNTSAINRGGQPAVFSFVRDNLAAQNYWNATGAIILPWNIEVEHPRIQEGFLQFAVEFDRNLAAGRDRLQPSVGAEFLWQDAGIPWFNTQYFRGFYQFDTSFEGEGFDSTFLFEWEPVESELGIGQTQDLLLDLLEYRLRPVLQVSQTNTINSRNAAIPDGSDYWQLGGMFQLNLYPIPRYMFGIATYRLDYYVTYGFAQAYGDLHDYCSRFHAAQNYSIDEAGNFTLSLEYDNVDRIAVGKTIDEFMINLGVRF